MTLVLRFRSDITNENLGTGESPKRNVSKFSRGICSTYFSIFSTF